MDNAKRIVHLTSAHPRDDVRIFHKQCRSLAAAGHEVFLVVADGLGDVERHGVRILDVGAAKGRLDRMIGATRRVLARARSLDADIYHLHDPELLPAGWLLRGRGRRVVFDAHEDLPQQILAKPYIPAYLRPVVAALAGTAERWLCTGFDAIIGATPVISNKFARFGMRSENISNFPLLDELHSPEGHRNKAPRSHVCYIGSISAARGVGELVSAMACLRSDVRLRLTGDFSEKSFRQSLLTVSGWERVDETGFLGRDGVRDVLGNSIAGMVTLHPTPAYVESLPVKMFEYMAAGLPVIASDFPLWREIIRGNDCGICVDPCDPEQIAQAIDTLFSDPGRAKSMGENGRRAVLERYNWDAEERKLLALYAKLFTSTPTRLAF